jgi:hypothetical protein
MNMTDLMERVRMIGTELDDAAEETFGLSPEASKALADDAWGIHLELLERARQERAEWEQGARVRERMANIWQHIQAMRQERAGWGADAQAGIDRMTYSWARARAEYLDNAAELWIDGGAGFSLGGYIGGVTFGCIARPVTERGFAPEDGWTYPEYEFSFHS